MTKGIKGTVVNGRVKAIPSKSYAHRIAICNFLAGNKPSAMCEGFSSNDIRVTEDCLERLVRGEKVLDCGESGSTLRFMLPLCSTLGGEFEFIGHGKLMERPNEELFGVLNAHGVSAKKGQTIKISGKLSSGEYKIRGDISSQYVSGLLMALPILDGDSKLVLTTPLVSAPYVDITLQVLESFGVKIQKTDYGFYIHGNAKYKGEILPEGDWSNSAFFLVLGAVAGKVTVSGLNLNSVQGDRYITEIIILSGAEIKVEGDCVTVSKTQLKPIDFIAEDCPDLVPIACVLAAYANGKSIIRKVNRLKIKESDRIQTTIAMLSGFGVKAEYDGENIIVHGGKVNNGSSESFNDHRIAMSASVLACGAQGESVIYGAQAVNKSYPTFFKDFNQTGGNSYDL